MNHKEKNKPDVTEILTEASTETRASKNKAKKNTFNFKPLTFHLFYNYKSFNCSLQWSLTKLLKQKTYCKSLSKLIRYYLSLNIFVLK